MRLVSLSGAVLIGLGVVSGCAFDTSLREYLTVSFWLPFAKHGSSFERPGVRRMSAAFAGMTAASDDTPLGRLRAAYQKISDISVPPLDAAAEKAIVAAARADRGLTAKEREEVDLIEAKIDMRDGESGDTARLDAAAGKLQAFLDSARAPEFRSEARGWLAHIYYLEGDQTRAGKMYLDELNRNGSNLGRQTLLDSLQMNYGYDGGPELLAHLEEYFDTPEHATFAIQLATNPRWPRIGEGGEGKLARYEPAATQPAAYSRIRDLLRTHRGLFRPDSGATALTLLAMRTALRMGDPAEAVKIAEAVPAGASVRKEADFHWMLGSAYFLTRRYQGAESPLRALFDLKSATSDQKAAAAYGLCGVYSKTGNGEEQLRYALWLASGKYQGGWAEPAHLSDLSLYWAPSGWDLRLLLDAELPIQTLQSFISAHQDAPGIRLVQYSLAVRLSRANRYAEAAGIYREIHANRRAPRAERLSSLYEAANQPGISAQDRLAAQFRLAEFIAANPDGIYFNDAAWQGLQRYALQAASDTRLTRQERERLIQGERALKDEQEERWRAFLILRDCVREAGPSQLGRKAAALALKCLRGINTDRFGREQEIRQADLDLSNWLRRSRG